VPIVHYETDTSFHDLYDEAQQKTQMASTDNALRRLRHYTLMQLLQQANLKDGNVVELGTFHGLSAYQIASQLNVRESGAIFSIFDSFEGLSEIKEEDRSTHAIDDDSLREQFSYGEDLVKQNLCSFTGIEFYKGWIPDRFQEVDDQKFSFVHIDVDLYEPIKDSINFFYPKLIKGGIMVFDDYGFTTQFPGAKKAVDEALSSLEHSFFMALPSGQAFIIK
jgi:predicted O-methyltransferase YrrM